MGGQSEYICNFNPKSIRAGSNILVIGKKMSGKTTLVEDLLSHIAPSVDVAVAFLSDANEQKRMSRHMPSIFIRNSSDIHLLTEIQDLLRPQTSEDDSASSQQDIQQTPHTCLIIENAFSCHREQNKRHMNYIQELVIRGSASNTTVIWIEHSTTQIPPYFRANTDYVFFIPTGYSIATPTETRMIYNKYFPIFDTISEFQTALQVASSGGYGCIVIDNAYKHWFEIDVGVVDCVFKYCATTSVPSFRLGRLQEHPRISINILRLQQKTASPTNQDFIDLLKATWSVAVSQLSSAQKLLNPLSDCSSPVPVGALTCCEQQQQTQQSIGQIPALLIARDFWFNSPSSINQVKDFYAYDRHQCVKCIVNTFKIPCINGAKQLVRDMAKSCPPGILQDILDHLRLGATFEETYQSYLTILESAVKDRNIH